MNLKKCVNGTEENCTKWSEEDILSLKEESLEEIVWHGLKMWHLILLSISGVLSLIILLCCCVKFRIPRTKQEIEADYIRRQILRKFRKRLKAIQNQELDEMDLKKALDKIRAEFKSDTESLAQSEAGFSAGTISSTGPQGHGTYRRASQIQIDISLEELRAHSLGLRARLALAFSRFCGRSKVPQGDRVALTVDAEGEAQLVVPEGAFKKKDSKKDPKESKELKTKDPKEPKKDLKDPKEPKTKEPKKPSKKDLKDSKDSKPQVTSMEVKGQALAPVATTSKGSKKTSEPIKDKEKDKDKPKPDKEKEQKDKEIKEKEKLEKQKAKEEKEKKAKEEKEKKKMEKEQEKLQKAEKVKLKIENEKAAKALKDKEKLDKKDKDKGPPAK